MEQIYNVVNMTLMGVTVPELRNMMRDTLEGALRGLEKFCFAAASVTSQLRVARFEDVNLR
jgi:hypothetical protein